MPELPEVEFCGRRLERWSAGGRVAALEIVDPRSVRDRRTDRPTAASARAARVLRATVVGKRPEPPIRHGKRLLWPFGDNAVLLTLGMTGKWTRQDDRFVRVRLIFDDGRELRFIDPRLLGGLFPCTRAEGEVWLREGLGPDALREGLPRLRGGRAVKLALMDQAVVAGLGNLHAAEALWRAGLHPATPASAITGGRHDALASAVEEQLRLTLAFLEAEDEITYVEERGAPNPFPLYDREGEPCPRCNDAIQRFIQGGRSTWWCPTCQPAGTS